MNTLTTTLVLLPFLASLGVCLTVATAVIVGVVKVEHMKITGHPAVSTHGHPRRR